MAGDYLHPKRVYRIHQPVLKEDLNANLLQAAERISGEVGPHNIESRAKGLTLPLAVAAATIPHLKAASVDPGISVGATGYPTTAGSGPDATFKVGNNYEWQLITNSSGSGDDMIETLTVAGRTLVKVWGKLEYAKSGNDGLAGVGSAVWAQNTHSAEVQFALRVDGEVVKKTMPGFNEESVANAWPIRVGDPKNVTFPIPPRKVHTRRSHAMGPGMKSYAVAWTLFLEPGTHTVELVARRVFLRLDRRRTNFGNIYVYSRRLICLEHPQKAAATSSAQVTTIPAFAVEQVVSDASLNTARVEVIQDACNQSSGGGLGPGAIARGAFTNKHLPSPLLACDIGTITPTGIQSTNNDYGGYTSTAVAPSVNGNTGWWALEDGGAPAYLRATNGGAGFGTSTSSQDESFIIVIADVEVVGVKKAALSAAVGYFGMLKLGYYSNGAWVFMHETTSFVNDFAKHLVVGVEKTPVEERTNVTLIGVLDLREAGDLLANDIDHFQVFGCAADAVAGVANDVQLRWQRGSIMVLQFRK